MTPKEKAQELVWKFNDNVQWDLKEVSFNGYTSEVVGYNLSYETKKFALIAVNEILDTLKIFLGEDKSSEDVVNFTSKRIIYWEEVKQEIEKL